MSDKATLTINGTPVPEIISYTIRYDLFNGSASMACTVPSQLSPIITDYPRQFVWSVNDVPVMKGYVDRVDVSYSKGSYNCTMQGRDMMSVLIDNYILNPKPYPDPSTGNKTMLLQDAIKDILESDSNSSLDSGYNIGLSISSIQTVNSANKLVTTKVSPSIKFSPSDASILVKFTPDAKKLLRGDYSPEGFATATKKSAYALKRARTWHGQTLFDAISNQCNAIGLYLYNEPGTDNILIHTLQQSNQHPVSYLPNGNVAPDSDSPYKVSCRGGVEGSEKTYPDNNVIECSLSENVGTFYNFVRLIGQSDSDVEEVATSSGWSETTQNKLKIEHLIPADINSGWVGLNKALVKTVHTVNTNAWLTNGDRVVNNVLLQQTRGLVNLRYTLPGHSESGKTPYFVNHLVDVTDESFGNQRLLNQQFLVYGVQFSGSKAQGQRTELELCLPGVHVNWRSSELLAQQGSLNRTNS